MQNQENTIVTRTDNGQERRNRTLSQIEKELDAVVQARKTSLDKAIAEAVSGYTEAKAESAWKSIASGLTAIGKLEADLDDKRTLNGEKGLQVYTYWKLNPSIWQNKADNLKAFIVGRISEDGYNRLMRNIQYYKDTYQTDDEKALKQELAAIRKAKSEKEAVRQEKALKVLQDKASQVDMVKAESEKEADKLRERIQALETENGKYASGEKIEALQAELDTARREANEYKARLEGLTSANKALQMEVKALQIDKANLEAKLAKYTAKAVKASAKQAVA